MTPNPLIELARTLVSLRSLAREMGIEWDQVLEAAEGIFAETPNSDAESKAHTDK